MSFMCQRPYRSRESPPLSLAFHIFTWFPCSSPVFLHVFLHIICPSHSFARIQTGMYEKTGLEDRFELTGSFFSAVALCTWPVWLLPWEWVSPLQEMFQYHRYRLPAALAHLPPRHHIPRCWSTRAIPAVINAAWFIVLWISTGLIYNRMGQTRNVLVLSAELEQMVAEWSLLQVQ